MSEPARAAVEIRGLVKRFRLRRSARELLQPWRPRREVEALAGVDLGVRRGELVALLGPNGAGKSTLLEILATLVAPSAGAVRLEGVDVDRDPAAARRFVGYVLTEERSFFWRLSVRDNLRFFAALQGLFGEVAARRIDVLAGMFGLSAQLDREFMHLSAGQKQRVAIARGLLADPPVVLFDEATRSLDPGRAERVRQVVRELLVEQAGKAVIFATHDLEEARALADRVVLMVKGRIAAEGPYEVLEPEVLRVFREEARAEDPEVFELLPTRGARS